MTERQSTSVSAFRDSLNKIWPISWFLEARQVRRLRKESYEEILAAAHNARIEMTSTCLSPYGEKRRGTNNSARWELECLKYKGIPYFIECFVNDGSRPIPQEFRNRLHAQIGGIVNPQYPEQAKEYAQQRSEVYEEIVRPLFAQEYEESQAQYAQEVAQWEIKHQKWAATPMETWQKSADSERQVCHACLGEGRHGTGQSGIGDVYCDECGTSGYLGPSAEEIKKSQEPEYPTSPIPNIREREYDMLMRVLHQRGIQEPQAEFGVYVRFVRTDNRE